MWSDGPLRQVRFIGSISSRVRIDACATGLPVRADHTALDRLPRPEGGDEFVGRLAGLDAIGDDIVGIDPCPAVQAALVERPAADLFADVVEGRPRNEQESLARRDGGLERAIGLAGHVRDPLTALPREEVNAGPANRPAGPFLDHLALDRDAEG